MIEDFVDVPYNTFLKASFSRLFHSGSHSRLKDLTKNLTIGHFPGRKIWIKYICDIREWSPQYFVAQLKTKALELDVSSIDITKFKSLKEKLEQKIIEFMFSNPYKIFSANSFQSINPSGRSLPISLL